MQRDKCVVSQLPIRLPHCCSVQTAPGNRENECEQPPGYDTSSCCQHLSTSLQPATAGSLGIDLASAVTVTLMMARPEKVPTGVKGPIVINGRQVGTLILGHSSASLLGLFVLPGIIDADFTGELCIMVHTPFPPVRIEKGQRIAQVVPLPQMTQTLALLQQRPREDRGFGSTGGLTMLTIDLSTHPRRKVEINYKGESPSLMGLFDTAADSSISAGHPIGLLPSTATVTGVGGLTLAKKMPPVTVTVEGKRIKTTLSIVPLTERVQCLIGRDPLAQLASWDLQWLRPIVGIPNDLLDHLHPLLQGTDPAHPGSITREQHQALQDILDCVTHGQVARQDPLLPIDLTTWCGPRHLLGALTQTNRKTGEEWVLEWLIPPLQQHRTLSQKIEYLVALIKRGRKRILQITGEEPRTIRVLMGKETLDWYLLHSMELQEALLEAGNVFSTEHPPHPILRWIGPVWATPLGNAIHL
ncbi:hypothetical protein DV515_00015556 [Chloebia gouldiae]|uniref:Peptidase A2 domain-containing protein n=1 Tax=Chloebia gouldiae TaxID=44316 RepID=A0A3L8RW84_CHLGU|nr:hypothetical protein DV515_00015556 [Chloebia gouldiae]